MPIRDIAETVQEEITPLNSLLKKNKINSLPIINTMFSDKAIYIYLIMNYRIGTFLANTFVRLFDATILKQTTEKNRSL